MVDFFDKLYTRTVYCPVFVKKMRLDSLARFFIRLIANALLPVYFILTSGCNAYTLNPIVGKSPRLIVSLTSFPGRINKIWMVIETLLRQHYKPDMIILWLSKNQFQGGWSMLPKRLLRMQKRGLKIEFKDEDLRSHKKYYYTIKEYPDDIMITVDDDIFYRSDMIAKLMAYHKKDSIAVVANYAFKITYRNGIVSPYNQWINNNDIVYDDCFGKDVFFGSGGGTLFAPHSLHEEVVNKSVFMDLCMSADDVWLNFMCRLNKYYVRKTNYGSILLPILNRRTLRLADENVLCGKNDLQIRNLTEYCIKTFGVNPLI